MPPVEASPKTRIAKRSRLNELLKHDARILTTRSPGCHIIGLDEVGRGSLIGAVIGGAVCLPRELTRPQKKLLTWLDDSKKLTADVRAELSAAIHAFCLVGLGQASKDEIDTINIHYASLLALYRAFQELCQKAALCPDASDVFLMMDGRAVIPDYDRSRQQAIIKGDGQSAAIAAASIVAKHARDTMVKALALEFPGYDWEKNMGYGTPAHIRGIRELGLTPLHRKNFKQAQQQLSLVLD